MAKKQQQQPIETTEKQEPKKIRRGMLFSRLNYAAKFIYNKEVCMITARGKIRIENMDLIEQPLTPGLLLREID